MNSMRSRHETAGNRVPLHSQPTRNLAAPRQSRFRRPVGLDLPLCRPRSPGSCRSLRRPTGTAGISGVQLGKGRAHRRLTHSDIRNGSRVKGADGQRRAALLRGIEVGHIFQRATIYSEAMQATFLDAKDKSSAPSWDATAWAHPAGGRHHRAEPRRTRHLRPNDGAFPCAHVALNTAVQAVNAR